MLDVELLMNPVSPGQPSGPNLEYHPSYTELERLLAGKPERQVGDTVAAAEPPEWSAAVPRLTALLGSSKDLRVAANLARALLEVESFSGLADGLALIRRLIEERWDTVHPILEPDDDNDPTRRLNAVSSLSHREMLGALRVAPIVVTRAAGELQLRDIEAAKAGKPLPARPALEAVLSSASPDELLVAEKALERCLAESVGIERAWAAHLSAPALDLSELKNALARASEPVHSRLAQLRPGSPGKNGSGSHETESVPVAQMGGLTNQTSQSMNEIRSRDDVVRVLDLVCAYYARFEPSSPVPVLLERCKRLVRMSFVDIVKDMIPDGLARIETIAGKPTQ